MKASNTLTLLSAALLLSACGGEGDNTQARGPDPKLPEQQSSLLPSMKIAEPTPWGNEKPKVPDGYSVTAIATDLAIPRQTLVLPNGDILVAEGRGGSAAKLKPKDVIASVIKAQGNTKVKSGNRITLLRDADGDGTYELKTVFADNLNADRRSSKRRSRNRPLIPTTRARPGETLALATWRAWVTVTCFKQ